MSQCLFFRREENRNEKSFVSFFNPHFICRGFLILLLGTTDYSLTQSSNGEEGVYFVKINRHKAEKLLGKTINLRYKFKGRETRNFARIDEIQEIGEHQYVRIIVLPDIFHYRGRSDFIIEVPRDLALDWFYQ